MSQIVKEFLTEHTPAAKIGDILLIKTQALHILDELLQTGKDGKATSVRDLTEKHIKDGNSIPFITLEIAVRHCQFVKVDEHRQIAGRKVLILHFKASLFRIRAAGGGQFSHPPACFGSVPSLWTYGNQYSLITGRCQSSVCTVSVTGQLT